MMTARHIGSLLMAVGLSAGLLGAANAGTKTWNTTSGDWFNDGNWDGGGHPVAGDDAVIAVAGASVLLTNDTEYLSSLTLSQDLVFSNWNSRLQATNVTIQSGGVMTHAGPFTDAQMSNNVYVVCVDLTIDNGGKIDTDQVGFAHGDPGTSMDGYGPGGANGAGGYGGTGGQRDNRYGSATMPLEPGSGGYSGTVAGHPGGHGAGAIRIEADGQIVINGSITANGQAQLTGYGSAPGSGGGVYIKCDTVDGSGEITVDGGKGVNHGGGGGGRIAIDYTPVSQSAVGTPNLTVSAAGGPYTNTYARENLPGARVGGELGTLYFPDTKLLGSTLRHSGHLVIPGLTTWAMDTLTVTGNIRFPFADLHLTVTNNLTINGATAALQLGGDQRLIMLAPPYHDRRYFHSTAPGPRLDCGGNLILTNGGDMAVFAAGTNAPSTYGARVSVTGNVVLASSGSWIYPQSHYSNGASALFSMDNLTVADGAGFDAKARGYSTGWSANQTGYGPGAVDGGPAGYGGVAGGKAITYGSASAPTQPGSGGEYGSANHPGGNGGGLVYIQARGDVTVNGTITADGERGYGYSSDAGSGGGVFITCNTFNGSGGLVTAEGGNGLINNTWGGGGGRISIVYTNTAAQDLIPAPDVVYSARGGSGQGDRAYGDIGTLYFPGTNLLAETMQHSGQVTIPGFTSWSVSSLVVINGHLGFRIDGFDLSVSGALTVQGADARLELGGEEFDFSPFRYIYSEPDGPSLTCGSLTVSNGAEFVIYAGFGDGVNHGAEVTVSGSVTIDGEDSWIEPVSHPTNGGSVFFSVGSLSINHTNSGFYADQRGYRCWTPAYGPGGGSGGGSYGGLGGNSDRGTYGSTNAPVQCGSAGYRQTYGRDGGGLVRIECKNTLYMNGRMTADGGSRTGWSAGGGSGGGVYLSCHTFDGTTNALLSAAGGYGAAGNGGGGRIAVWRAVDASPTVLVSTNVSPGYVASQPGYPAGADGTIVWGLLPMQGTIITIR